jgi:hypothetical protein
MAQPILMTAERSQALAAAISPECALYTLAEQNPDSVTLLESFPLFVVLVKDLETLAPTRGTIASVSRAMNVWHSQIAIAGQPALYARSRWADGSNTPSSLAVLSGRLPRLMSVAIAMADLKFDDQYSARLLILPEFHLYALLFSRSDQEQLLIVDSLFASHGLGQGIVSGNDFVERVLSVPRPIGLDLRK